MVNSLAARIAEGLFPHECALCGLNSHRPIPLCLDCEVEMPRNDFCCSRCAIPLPALAHSAQRICGACLNSAPPYDRVIAPWLYGEYFAHLIHLWKYQRQRRMTPLLGTLWRQAAAMGEPVDVLVPVPLHWRRLWWRGFNQAELLARYLQANGPQLKHCALDAQLVRRVRATPAQSGMNARQRAGNLSSAFTVRKPCDNLRIAMVDDVMTTGATARAVSAALKNAGASYIELWCLARTPTPGD